MLAQVYLIIRQIHNSSFNELIRFVYKCQTNNFRLVIKYHEWLFINLWIGVGGLKELTTPKVMSQSLIFIRKSRGLVKPIVTYRRIGVPAI